MKELILSIALNNLIVVLHSKVGGFEVTLGQLQKQHTGSAVTRKSALNPIMQGVALAVLIIAAVISAAAALALADLSKDLTTVILIAGVFIAAAIAAVASIDG